MVGRETAVPPQYGCRPQGSALPADVLGGTLGNVSVVLLLSPFGGLLWVAIHSPTIFAEKLRGVAEHYPAARGHTLCRRSA